MSRLEPGDDVVYGAEAKIARSKGEILLQPASAVTVNAGEAITWENKADEIFTGAQALIVETLEHPNSINAGASDRRMSAALGAGVLDLEPAIDAAESAQAANSIEKMLCHQMAGAHFHALRLLEQIATPRLPAGEVARLTNAAAWMMDVYQAG